MFSLQPLSRLHFYANMPHSTTNPLPEGDDMSEEGDRLIAKAQEKIRGLEREAIKTKEFINQLCEFEGLEPLYKDVGSPSTLASGSIRSDQFYGRPLATVVREILLMRRDAGQSAASVNDIYAKLVEGGYKFDAANEDNAKRSLRISLTKNPAFHKIPNGDYGLSEWYPTARTKRERTPENGHTATDIEADAADAIAPEVDIQEGEQE